ncbi:hypothetical protein GCM10023322_20080 [Rugosimonospora acidiphila]|uniref:Squalene cyclase C-terminal domain-containing protein n=1 Tax=Rugosimonospora acidiphila TaxID=556531 RepID=A0ABP9RNQ3_9ACTN
MIYTPATARSAADSEALRNKPSGPLDVSAEARELLTGLLAAPWGQISPSVYETGRLVALAPWLAGHPERVEFLCGTQGSDGAWPGPDGYALVPTLSATEALLGILIGEPQRGTPTDRLVTSVHKGLDACHRLLSTLGGDALPDTPAIELIVPALTAALNEHLDRLPDPTPPGLAAWRGRARLPLPPGVDASLLAGLRARLAGPTDVPLKLLHSLEILGGAGRVRVGHTGTVGASPAATAAWLAAERRDPAGMNYLETVVATHGGPVPSVIPITMFERSWVLSGLHHAGLNPAGLDAATTGRLLDELSAALGPAGASGGTGLPPDADTTSVVLLTLAQLGRRPDVDCLWNFQADDHFCVWPGERTTSPTANAHVLETLGHHLTHRVTAPERYTAAVRSVADWLSQRQRPDGSWSDKWHASPYYATACCALALHRYGGRAGTAAVDRAIDFVMSTQDSGGGWGRWGATAEETGYALQVLLVAAPGRGDAQAARGYRYLRATYGQRADPPLWHDKDLYLPAAVVRGGVLAALALASGNPAVAGEG